MYSGDSGRQINDLITRSDISRSLSELFGAGMRHLVRFFVAFLKFLAIVQSGSILFRKLDPGEAG